MPRSPLAVFFVASALGAAAGPQPAAAAPVRGAFLGFETLSTAELGDAPRTSPAGGEPLSAHGAPSSASAGSGDVIYRLRDTSSAMWQHTQHWLGRSSSSFLALRPSQLLAMWHAQKPNALAPDQPADKLALTPAETALAVVLELLFQVVIVGLGAYLYIQNKPDPLVTLEGPEKKDDLDGEFKHSLFACLEMPGTTAFVCCCCEGIRWADNMRLLGTLTFFKALALWMVLNCACTLLTLGGVGTPLLSLLILTGMLSYYRQELRGKFNMKTGPGVVALDCLSYAFCGPCTIVQDTRQLEEGQLLGHEAVSGAHPLSLS